MRRLLTVKIVVEALVDDMAIHDTFLAVARRAARGAYYGSHIPKLFATRRKNARPDVCFLWVPKAAGTSVYLWLHSEIGMTKLKEAIAVRGGFGQAGPVTFGHMNYAKMLENGWVTREYDRRAFKFAIVRHPVDRALSLYFYLKNRKKTPESFLLFLQEIQKGIDPVGLYNHRGLSQCNPQSAWLYANDGSPLFDRLYKMEEMKNFVADMNLKFGIEKPIPHANKTERSEKFEEWKGDEKVKRLIYEIYDSDFRNFHYS